MRCSVLVAALACVAAVAAQDPVSVDDSDPSIVYYTPSGSWTHHTNQAASFQLYQNSDSFTSVKGATITWKFKGSHVEYWGNTGSYHGPCLVTLDGGNEQTVSSNAAQTGPPIKLYDWSNLDPAVEHTIVITVVADSYPNVCELDRFVYIPAAPSNPTSTSKPPTSSSGSGSSSNGGSSGSHGSANSSKSSPPWGAIGGAIGGGLAGGIIIAMLIYWWCRRQKKSEDLEDIIAQQPTVPVIASSLPPSPFPTRPNPTITSSKANMAASTRPPSTAYTASVYPTSAATTDGQFTGLMPVAYPDVSSRHTSTYGSEASYGAATSPTQSMHSTRPLVIHNSSAGSAHSGGNGPGRRAGGAVLSAATELDESESLAAGQKGHVDAAPVAAATAAASAAASDEKRRIMSAETETSAAGASGSGPSSARPLVQHTDGGVVQAPSGAEELPPAYNDQWQSGQRR